MVKSGGVFDLTFLDTHDENYAFYISMSLICCMLSALAAGLTMAYLSLDRTKLRMLERNGTEAEKEQVRTVMPLLHGHHRLLVTLLLSNTLSNEALPIFLDSLVPSWLALVLSVTAVTIFCEILPQSVSTGKHKLKLAFKFAPIMRAMLVLFYPIAVPAARLLDVIIHDDSEPKDKKSLETLMQFTKEELLAMVDILREDEHASIIAEEGHSLSFSSKLPRASSSGSLTGSLSQASSSPGTADPIPNPMIRSPSPHSAPTINSLESSPYSVELTVGTKSQQVGQGAARL